MICIGVLNGPNLNLLGSREPAVYGSATLADLERLVRAHGDRLGVAIEFMQSNHEGVLVDAVQALRGHCDGAVVNLGGYTHTSIAIRDALLAVAIPFVEVHLSNLFKREAVRHHSVSADLAVGLISGFGPAGYVMALDAIVATVSRTADAGSTKPTPTARSAND